MIEETFVLVVLVVMLVIQFEDIVLVLVLVLPFIEAFQRRFEWLQILHLHLHLHLHLLEWCWEDLFCCLVISARSPPT